MTVACLVVDTSVTNFGAPAASIVMKSADCIINMHQHQQQQQSTTIQQPAAPTVTQTQTNDSRNNFNNRSNRNNTTAAAAARPSNGPILAFWPRVSRMAREDG